MNKIIAIIGIAITPSIIFASPVDITVLAKAQSYWQVKGTAIQTVAQHDIEIINNTDQPQSYSYLYQYCGDEKECVNAESTITVMPHTAWNNHHDSILWVNYFKGGYYTLTAKTIVNSATVHEQKTSYGTVTVG